MSELEIIQHQKIQGISVFFDTVEYRTPHFHPEWELIWITDGHIQIQCGQEILRGETGELFLFSPGKVHEFSVVEGPVTFLCLQIAPQSLGEVCPELHSLTAEGCRVGEWMDPGLTQKTRELLRQLMVAYLEQEELFQLHCVSLCTEILFEILRAIPVRALSEEERRSADKRRARLNRFLRFVDENYMRKIRLADFAQAEGCSVSYLSRFLKEELGQTFQDYVSSIRYHSACRMIRSGGMRLLDVCEEAGFSDYRYFSNCFKRFSGCTPEVYSRTAHHGKDQIHQKSIYSRERFYTREESIAMLRSL